MNLLRRTAAECVGTAMLLLAVVGSGIMGERLAGGIVGLALLANAVATGGALVALILCFAPISGAHLNPMVSLSLALVRQFPVREVPAYVMAQVAGGVVGMWIAHLMFGEPVLHISEKTRSGAALIGNEVVATFGLLIIILLGVRHCSQNIAHAVAVYISGAYWFAASTFFANPAVTIARSVTDSFAGIRPLDAPYFLIAPLMGGLLATAFAYWLYSSPDQRAAQTYP